MIKETAPVVAVDGDKVTVEAAIKSTCSSCQAQSDCGTGVVSRALAPKTQYLTLNTPMTVHVGQQVTVGIPEAGVLSASAWLYLLPLFTFIAAFFTISEALLLAEIRHELAALLPTVALTYFVYRFIASKLSKIESTKYQPVLLKHIETD